MRKNAKSAAKRRATKTPALKDLGVKDGKAVKGGRKAGGTSQEYLVYTLSDATISSVSVSDKP